jgi:hypothetical protein
VNTTRSSSARRLSAALPLLAFLAGCSGETAGNQPAASERASEKQESVSARGEIPARRPSRIEEKLVPPRAVLGSDPDPSSPSLVFQAPEEPARLLGWLRATANGADFVLESEMQEGAEHVLSGRVRATGRAFSVRIAPGGTGGTTGTVLVTAH